MADIGKTVKEDLGTEHEGSQQGGDEHRDQHEAEG